MKALKINRISALTTHVDVENAGTKYVVHIYKIGNPQVWLADSVVHVRRNTVLGKALIECAKEALCVS